MWASKGANYDGLCVGDSEYGSPEPSKFVSSPKPEKSCPFVRQPPDGCEKVKVIEDTRWVMSVQVFCTMLIFWWNTFFLPRVFLRVDSGIHQLIFCIALVVACQPSEVLCLLSSLDSSLGLRLYFIHNRRKQTFGLLGCKGFFFFSLFYVCICSVLFVLSNMLTCSLLKALFAFDVVFDLVQFFYYLNALFWAHWWLRDTEIKSRWWIAHQGVCVLWQKASSQSLHEGVIKHKSRQFDE